MKTWNAIYVKSRAEKKVMKSLLEMGIEAYVPLKKTLKQWSDRKKMVEEPLITGYVFVNLISGEREKVFTVNGIVNFLRFNGKDAIVRNEEIEVLKKIIAIGYSLSAEPINSDLRPGDYVIINDGPLKGLMGSVKSEGKNDKVEVLLSSIGQVIKAIVPREIVALKEVNEK